MNNKYHIDLPITDKYVKLSNIFRGLRKTTVASVIILLMVVISGCSTVPGGHINSSGWFHKSQQGDDKVNLIPITSDLINSINANSAYQISRANPELQKLTDSYKYLVGVGDVLNIVVWDHPELTIPAGQFRSAGETGNVVHPDGAIFYPYIGRVAVSGLDVTQIRDRITEDLSKYIGAPQVDVSVAVHRSKRVFISGAVQQPSTVPITNVPLTVLDALNACGGLAADADWKSVVLTSKNEQGVTKEVLDLYALYQLGDMTQNRLLSANDLIHVPRNDSLKVFVMGDVVKAETQIISRNGLSLAEALNNAGGINEASASGIFVLRSSDSQDKIVDVFQLDASTGAMLVLSTKFKLQPMDMVYVTSAPVARWNKVIQQLLPTFTSIYQIDRLTDN
ncbi:MAG: polysaccharide export protein [Porticoccaceae bacterium]